MSLAGKVALVTGAASGIGAATADALAAGGAEVWRADLRALGKRGLSLDVTSPEDWQAATKRITDASGALHILVNAAGISRGGAADALPDADLEGWRRVFAVNVEGVLLGCQAAIRLMEVGAIVNLCSTVAEHPTPTLAAYGASKAAVLQLTRTVASWCADNGKPIRCNAVLPGMTDTPLIAGLPVEARAAWEAQIPAGRFAGPEEVAAAIVFLASDAASYINGVGLPVDGGFLSRAPLRPRRA